MATDRTMSQWAEDAAHRLKSVSHPGYYQSVLPIEADDEIAEIVGAVLDDPSQRGPALVAHLDNNRCAGTLWVFGLRAAALARRTGDPRYLDLAVLAIGLSFNGTDYYRNGATALQVPWHAAQHLGLDPGPIYRRVAALPTGEGAKFVLGFAERRHENRKLDAHTYRETFDAGGVRYERDPL